jgi:hypothetical protein
MKIYLAGMFITLFLFLAAILIDFCWSGIRPPKKADFVMVAISTIIWPMGAISMLLDLSIVICERLCFVFDATSSFIKKYFFRTPYKIISKLWGD